MSYVPATALHHKSSCFVRHGKVGSEQFRGQQVVRVRGSFDAILDSQLLEFHSSRKWYIAM